ncbi:MAG: hypothetical protein S4CHLAM45_12370 [Chlamydiales bacterium]|nr:hypothetical protein [Chlamydiales bacterium]MCH9619726.1 hypothetical protein [Chlamydiales bacterium]MCH9623332.1 hypothetical protein [Chlamydiales bacterium]
MHIWAIADLHLAKGVPNKKMDVFGPNWVNYMDKIEENWRAVVTPDDLVLIAGDISWAMKMEEAKIDLKWIDTLPGTKVLIRGNHDYWWSSATKVRAALPPSLHIVQNDAFVWNGVSIGGARLWDTDEFSFNPHVEKDLTREKIFLRELNRLELSLKALTTDRRIVMTHYPPIGADLEPTRASKLLEKYKVNDCIFGHLHNVQKGQLPFGESGGVHYQLTACDYLGFKPYCLF